MTEHAKLSASGAHRWLSCPGSIKAEENIPRESNKYADEGAKAHEIAANELNKIFNKDVATSGIKHTIPYEMEKAIDDYVKYVKDLNDDCLYRLTYFGSYQRVFIEQKVDFSNIVPEGFGTADCIIVDREELHVIDFKYGFNHVYAQDNMQLLLYAIGTINTVDIIMGIEKITLHIVQPRANNFSTWEITIEELYSYYKYIEYKALEALKDDAPRIPSEEACKWCKARFTCYALKNTTKKVNSLIDKQDLTNNDIRYILDNAGLVRGFLSSIEDKIYEQINNGIKFDGYKLVEGRSVRKLKDGVEEKIVELLGEKAYNKSIINITELDKLLTKDEVKSLVYLSKSKPKLVKESDKRNSIIIDSLISEVIDY
jgi:hypothetical protein